MMVKNRKNIRNKIQQNTCHLIFLCIKTSYLEKIWFSQFDRWTGHQRRGLRLFDCRGQRRSLGQVIALDAASFEQSNFGGCCRLLQNGGEAGLLFEDCGGGVALPFSGGWCLGSKLNYRYFVRLLIKNWKYIFF